MITEDVELTKKIFELINGGIDDPYDDFYFEAFLYEGYIVRTLSLNFDGVLSKDVKTSFNGPTLCEYLEALQANSIRRGERWCGIAISYKNGGKVSVKFKYEYPDM